jgi:hypothetical protein
MENCCEDVGDVANEEELVEAKDQTACDAKPGSVNNGQQYSSHNIILSESAIIASCRSVERAAAALKEGSCIASFVTRPLSNVVSQQFAEYVATRPKWEESEHQHPMEATVDRVVVIDFQSKLGRSTAGTTNAVGQALPSDGGLFGAIGYGRGLPPRASPQVASAAQAISQVVRVLPPELADIVANDAAELLLGLRVHTNRRQFIVRLELVVGDTCQRWHSDMNISRCLVTYAGPGTFCAHEAGVTRAHGSSAVESVNEASAMQMGTGDILLMKGGVWEGSQGRGAAHRAPPIGPVQTCSVFRLVLKVDVSEDF